MRLFFSYLDRLPSPFHNILLFEINLLHTALIAKLIRSDHEYDSPMNARVNWNDNVLELKNVDFF